MKRYTVKQYTETEYDAKCEAAYAADDFNTEDDVITIVWKEKAVCMDIMANGKRLVPILRKIEESMTEEGLAGESGIYAGWFGSWADSLRDPFDKKYFIWDYDGRQDMEQGHWSYSWGIEQIDDDRWYIFLNLARPEETTSEHTEQPEEKEEGKTMMKVSEIERPVLTSDADALCDYDSGYICDVISEIADNRTSIYYSDIIKFISEHVEEVNEAIAEFGWDGCGSDLYKAGQMAEYCMIEREIYDELEDGLTVRALDYIEREMKIEQITPEQWDAIAELCASTDNNDRIDDFLSEVENIVNGEEEDSAEG